MLPFPRLALPLLIAAALAGGPAVAAQKAVAPAPAAAAAAPADAAAEADEAEEAGDEEAEGEGEGEEEAGEEEAAAAEAAPAPAGAAAPAATPAAPSAAAPAGAAAPPAEAPPAAPPAEPLFGLEYKIGAEQPKTAQVFEHDPFAPLLEIIKQTADLASKSKMKPAMLNTEIKMLLPPDAAKDLGELPPVKMDTTVQGDGSGKSVFNMPAYQKTITEKGNEGSIQWQGFNGEVAYKDPQLTSPAGKITFPGLQVHVNAENVDIQFKDLMLGGALDADWLPRKLEFSLPVFTLKSPDGDMSLSNLAFHGEVTEAKPGLDIGKGGFKLDNFSFKSDKEKMEFRIDGLNLSGDGKLAGEVVNYALNLGMSKLFAAGEMIPPDSNEYSYDSTLELRNIDAAATAELQKTVRELQKQQREGMISDDMIGIAMIGMVMQNLPKFWQKSPEFAITKFNLKTKQGDISGTANIKVDGTQKFDMENDEAMKKAISGGADVTIAKGILVKIFDMQIRESVAAMASAPAPEPAPAQPAKPGEPAKPATAAPAQPPAPPTEEQIKQMVNDQIQALVTQKWLVPAGADSFKLNAQFQQGKLIVNGQPMELPM